MDIKLRWLFDDGHDLYIHGDMIKGDDRSHADQRYVVELSAAMTVQCRTVDASTHAAELETRHLPSYLRNTCIITAQGLSNQGPSEAQAY